MATTPAEPSTAYDAACDPSTPPEALTRLARHRDRRVRARVASNPNTPLEALGSLARRFPEAACANPVLDWLVLEDANWPAEIDGPGRERMLASAACAPSLRWWGARSGSERDRLAVASNRAADASLLDRLRSDMSPDVREAAAAHNRGASGSEAHDGSTAARVGTGTHAADLVSLVVTGALPARLLDVIALDDMELRRAVAISAHTPRAVIEQLCVDDDEATRAAARRHTSLSPAFRAALDAIDADPTVGTGAIDFAALPETHWVRQAKARDPRARSDQLHRLAADQEWRVRELVAAHPNTPTPALVRLAGDPDKDVRIAVARNPASPAYLVALLATDRTDEVRDTARAREIDGDASRCGIEDVRASIVHGDGCRVLLARHPALPVDDMIGFAADPDWRVREACACNPSATAEIIDRLAIDGDSDVRRCAVSHRAAWAATIDAHADDDHEGVRTAVARATRSAAVLTRLSSDRAWSVREAVAANIATPDVAVLALAADDDGNVRAAVTARVVLDERALLTLALRADGEHRLALLARDPADRALLDALFASEGGARQTQRYLRVMGAAASATTGATSGAADGAARRPNDAATLVRRSPWLCDIVLAKAATSELLASLARGAEWRTRQLVADHDALPAASLSRLARDSDYDVRTAAATHPRLPADLIARLAEDVHGTVRAAIASRSDTPAGIVAALAFDDDEAVRGAALHHPALPPSARSECAALQAGNPIDVAALARHARGSTAMRLLVATNPSTPARVLRLLVRDDAWRVREAVARHPAATVAMLRRLAADSDRDVRRAVATHPRTPAELLVKLHGDLDALVRNAAIAHVGTPRERRDQAVRSTTRALLRSREPIAEVVVASLSEHHPTVLGQQRRWQSPLWRVREALAHNPATPLSVIAALRDDAHRGVRASARARLSIADASQHTSAP